MPGFAPLGTAPLGSVGGIASRQASVAGDFVFQGQALAGLQTSAAVYDDAPGFTGGAAAGGTVEAAGSFGMAGITGQAQGDTATHAIATGAFLSLQAAVVVRAKTTAAAVGTLGAILLARSRPVSAIRGDGAVPLAGAQGATSGISSSAAPLWQVLSHADAAAAIDGQVNDGRLLFLVGTGQGRAENRAEGAGTIGLTGNARLAVAALAHAETGVAAAGTAAGMASLGLTLAYDFGLTGAASGISLRVRVASASVEISLPGQSTGALLLNAGLITLYSWQGAAQGRGTVQAQSSGVIGVTRGIATEVHIGATAGRVLPLEGGAAAHSALRAEAQSAVVSGGSGGGLLAAQAGGSDRLSLHLTTTVKAGAMASAQGAIGVVAQVAVSAAIGLLANGQPALSVGARGQSLTTAEAAGARLSFDGQARAALPGAAAADARLAAQAIGTGHVGLSLTAEPRLALAATVAVLASLRADLQGTVVVSGRGDAAPRISAGTQTGSLPLAGGMRTALTVNAAALAKIAFARHSLGEVGIDAVSVPALGLDLTLKAKTATQGTSADTPAVRGAGGAALALAGQLQDELHLKAAAAMLAGITGISRSGVALAGVGHARVASKALAFGAVTVERQSDGDVAVVGTAQPALPIAGAAVLGGWVTGSSSNDVAPLSREVRLSAQIAAAAGLGLTVTGAATGGLAIAGQSVGRFHIARDGSADVVVTGETARIIAFPGRGAAAVANDAGTGSVFLMGLSITGGTRILLRLVGEAVQVKGTARSSVLIAAAVQDELWPNMLLARGFRAPPGLRRSASPNATQGGSVISHARGGVLLSEPRTGRILRG